MERYIDSSLPLASRHQKVKRRSTLPKKRSLIIVVVLTFLIFLVLIAGGFGVGGRLRGRYVRGGKWSERVINKRRLGKRKLIEDIDAHVLILATLVAEDHILALVGVMTPSEDILECPQDATEGGGRGSGRRRRSHAGACGARRSWSGRNIHGDRRSSEILRLKIYDFLVLPEVNARDLLYHIHNLWGITTIAKSVPGDAKNLL
jgi:hypothetical protein